jgi:chromosome partitioning protein
MAHHRVLIVDLDPQGHATLGFGYNPDAVDKTIYDVLVNPSLSVRDVILDTNIELLRLLPSNVLLSGAELDLITVRKKYYVLSNALSTLRDDYDICVIDCPPSLGLLTVNALLACTDVVVPVQVHYYAMEGLKQLFETANIIRERFHPCCVRILGLLLTIADDSTVFARQIQQQMRAFFGDLVFRTTIHRCVRLAEAPSAGQSVLTYAPKSKGALEYKAVAQEILDSIFPNNQQESVNNAAAEQLQAGIA